MDSTDQIRAWADISKRVVENYNENLKDENSEGVYRADILDEIIQQYDVSESNLKNLFFRYKKHFDTTQDEALTFDDFAAGLNSLLPAGAELQTDLAMLVCKLVDKDEDQRITYTDFKDAIKKIKLALLLNPDFELQDMDEYEQEQFTPDLRHSKRRKSVNASSSLLPVGELDDIQHSSIGLIQFSWDYIVWDFPPTIGNDTKRTDWERSFYFLEYKSAYYGDLGYSQDEHEGSLHWVCLFRPWTLRTILKLAVKYQLHPLAIEDLINLHEEKPKVDHYPGEYSFVVLPTVRLTGETITLLEDVTRLLDQKPFKGFGKPKQKQDRRRPPFGIRHTDSGLRFRSHRKMERRAKDSDTFKSFDSRKQWETIKSIGRMKLEIETTNIGIFVQEPPRSSVIITAHGQWSKLSTYSFENPDNNEEKRKQSTKNATGNNVPPGTHYGTYMPPYQPGLEQTSSTMNSTFAFLNPDKFEQGAKGGWKYALNTSTTSAEFMQNQGSGITLNNSKFTSLEDVMEGSIFDGDILKNIKSRRSRMRQYSNSTWVLYEIVDQVVDLLRPITDAYRFKLAALHHMLTKYGSNFKKSDRAQLSNTKSEIETLLREIRPLTAVVKHIRENCYQTELKTKKQEADKVNRVSPNEKYLFFDDVLEHLQDAISQFEECVKFCDSMMGEYRDFRDTKMNDILYVLTFITTVFVPTQFLTGLYGMNFALGDSAEELQDPMLRWEYGYATFWIMVVVLEVIVLGFFWYLGFLPVFD